ncbi:nucleoside-diphosphate kinase [archaeon]|jgi:nucleoside-diphosphate kinase|nr:nucleoside-diphosphate kinase [archaeon]MBT6824343.1 nucleoside-diphosphate kinase [archaeon]MBT7106893.1 nucleoside-diphosphate kinase [archaeon]MBT7297446.1 nucleoside-diphosphate kinase [archaeon]
MIEQTLVLIKPDGVKRGLIGEVTKRFELRGLKIVGLKMVQVEPDFSKKHYAAHVDKKFYKGLEKFIVSGPVVAMIIEGVDAVEVVRKIVGSTEPKGADVGTIRGDFAHISYEHADKKDKAIENLIHASGNSEEAKQEVALWFGIDELHSYKLSHEDHIY